MKSLSAPQNPLVRLGATQLAAGIARGEFSSVEVISAFRERHLETHAALNAIVVDLFEAALQQARLADEARSRGETLGPLHGVPITIKECFHVTGTPATLGLTSPVVTSQYDAPLVSRLKNAGAIVVGKTNVPQLMMWHECDNPRYGCTKHPLDLARTPGGSSGGEGAAIGAFCSPLGLGNDLGGSIRIPAAWCGIVGFKPTSGSLTNEGIAANFRGMIAMYSQCGPLARCVADLRIAWHVLQAGEPIVHSRKVPEVPLERMRIGFWTDDGYAAPAPAIQRAVREAAEAFRAQGCEVREVSVPTGWHELIDCYFQLMGSDGGADLRRLLRGSRIDHRVRRLVFLSRLPQCVRSVLAWGAHLTGDPMRARLLRNSGPLSADRLWQTCARFTALVARIEAQLFQENGIDLLITPPHVHVALPHGEAAELLAEASHSYAANLLGIPAGIVPWGVVQESDARPKSAGGAELARFHGVGLPLGVQISGPKWADERVLAGLEFLEKFSFTLEKRGEQS